MTIAAMSTALTCCPEMPSKRDRRFAPEAAPSMSNFSSETPKPEASNPSPPAKPSAPAEPPMSSPSPPTNSRLPCKFLFASIARLGMCGIGLGFRASVRWMGERGGWVDGWMGGWVREGGILLGSLSFLLFSLSFGIAEVGMGRCDREMVRGWSFDRL